MNDVAATRERQFNVLWDLSPSMRYALLAALGDLPEDRISGEVERSIEMILTQETNPSVKAMAGVLLSKFNPRVAANR